MSKIDRIGEKRLNNFGSEMIIEKYRNANDIDVFFPEYNWIFKHNKYTNFKRGYIKCPYEKRICGIGYLGEGKYSVNKNNKNTRCFKIWSHMLERCYNYQNLHHRNHVYECCTVCEGWHNYQNFAKWYEENYYKIGKEEMNLDKDILIKGNKIYSPDTCCFVPQRINKLFTKSNALRGEYPIGVNYSEIKNKFISRCNIGNGKRMFLGHFDNMYDAFMAYKTYKEKLIKKIADEHESLIPQKLYEAMYRYEVEITD